MGQHDKGNSRKALEHSATGREHHCLREHGKGIER
jgi:hypothetical protein